MSSSRRRPERRLSIAQGRDAREIQLPPSAGKCFLLTSPFIERQRNPTAPVGGEVFSLDIPFHRTDETNSPARAASDPCCGSQATLPSSSVGSRWSHHEKSRKPRARSRKSAQPLGS